MTYLHDQIGVAHSTVDSKFSQSMSTIFLHCLENGFGLEAGCLKSCSRHMATFGIRCDANCNQVSVSAHMV